MAKNLFHKCTTLQSGFITLGIHEEQEEKSFLPKPLASPYREFRNCYNHSKHEKCMICNDKKVHSS